MGDFRLGSAIHCGVQGAMTIASVNPATGETLRTFEPYDEVEWSEGSH